MNTYRHILDHYGAENQVRQTLEELDELATTLASYSANDATSEEVIDELADVMVMCEQMCELFGRQAVNERIHYKLSRQLRRMERHS